MSEPVPVRKPKAPQFVVVVAVLQIIFGTLTACGPLAFFSGIPDILLAWQDRVQSQLPQPKGQPQISQLRIQKMIHERIPWLRMFERLSNGSSFLLSAMMIAGGVGMLYLRPWARQLTISWVLLSIVYTVAATAVGAAFIAPASMEVVTEIFEQIPAPPPGQPDMRPMLKSMMQSMGPIATVGAIFGALFPLAWAITVLILVRMPSFAGAFRRGNWEPPPGPLPAPPPEDAAPDDRIRPAPPAP